MALSSPRTGRVSCLNSVQCRSPSISPIGSRNNNHYETPAQDEELQVVGIENVCLLDTVTKAALLQTVRASASSRIPRLRVQIPNWGPHHLSGVGKHAHLGCIGNLVSFLLKMDGKRPQ